MPDERQIGFIGLGIMGRPMARNLMQAGHSLTVWNRSQPGIEALVAEGAQAGSSPRAVAEQVDIVISIVGDAPDVEQISLGDDGVIAAGRQGLVHIDMTTMSPAIARLVAERYAEQQIEFLDAPVSGGEQGAIDGTLSIMAGGKPEVFEKCRSVLGAMGKNIVYCGTSGAGQIVKLCNQVVVGLNNLAMSEAMVLAAKSGVKPETMLEAVRAGAGSSWALHNLAPRVLAADFKPGFKVWHQQKDLHHALDLAHSTGTPLPGTALVHQLFAALEADGFGEAGTQALVKALEKLANISVHAQNDS
jgi:3-hydroxyisobutyrate dehydrogenase